MLRAMLCCVVAAAGAWAQAPAIGAHAPEFTFKDIRFLPRTLADLGERKAYLLLFHTPEDGASLGALAELAKNRAEGVEVAALDVSPEADVVEVAANALKVDGGFTVLKDYDGAAARALGIEKTPAAVVLDGAKALRYRGTLEGAKAALEAVAAGQEVAQAETALEGKAIPAPTLDAPEKPNFAEHVAPIINENCGICHRPGEATPFSLRTYNQVASRGDMIAEVVREGRMPPWYAAEGHGAFMNDRRMSKRERDTLIAWVQTGMEKGDLEKAPAPPEPAKSEWRIGEPDLVIAAAEEDTIPATGVIDYKYPVLPYKFEQDTWVQGIEILPGNLKVVHHVNLAFNSPDKQYNEQGNFLTGRVPGNPPVDIMGPIAMLIPKGSVLFLQIHYVTTGKEEKNQMRVGIRYADGPIAKRVYYKRLRPADINIPPGDPRHRMESAWEFDRNAVGIALFSHMHVRGRDMSFFAKYPDGKEETLLIIPNYNFDWQLAYQYVPGMQLFPKGTQLSTVSHYDNSPFNPYNPDPTKTVTYGEQTMDEMNDAYVFFIDADENLNINVDGKNGQVLTEIASSK